MTERKRDKHTDEGGYDAPLPPPAGLTLEEEIKWIEAHAKKKK